MDAIFTIESLLDFYMHYLRDIATDFYLAKSVMCWLSKMAEKTMCVSYVLVLLLYNRLKFQTYIKENPDGDFEV